MPANLSIVVRLVDLASRSLGSVQRSLLKLGSGAGIASRALFSLQGAFAALGIVSSLSVLARSFVKTAAATEQYRVRFNVLLGSLEDGNVLLEDMAGYAKNVSFSYLEVADSATVLVGAMDGNVKEISRWIPLIGDLAAATGESIKNTAEKIGKMYEEGIKGGQAFRDTGILAMLGFKDGVEVSIEETRRIMYESWEGLGSRFRGTAEEMSYTWDGMLRMMGQTWRDFQRLVMDAGVFDYIKGALRTWIDFTKRLRDEGRLDEWAKNLARVVVKSFELIALSVAVVIDAFDTLRITWLILKAGFAGFSMLVVKGLYELQIKLNEFLEDLEDKAFSVGRSLKNSMIPGLRSVGKYLMQLDLIGEAERKVAADLKNSVKYWEDILDTSLAQIEAIDEQGLHYTRVKAILEEVRRKAAQARKDMEAAEAAARRAAVGPVPDKGPRIGTEAALKSQASRSSAIETLLTAQLKKELEERRISVDDYFKARVANAEDAYKKEVALLQFQRSQVKRDDPDRKQKISDAIFVAEQKHLLEILRLEEEKEEETRKLAQETFDFKQSLREFELRQLEASGARGVEGRFKAERAAMAVQHAREIEGIKAQALKGNKEKIALDAAYAAQKAEIARSLVDEEEALARERYTYEQQLLNLSIRAAATRATGLNITARHTAALLEMDDQHAKELERIRAQEYEIGREKELIRKTLDTQELERLRLVEEQKMEIIYASLTVYESILGETSSAFMQLYENSGKQVKAYFQIAKAAAIAETIISTYKAAQSAYDAAIEAIPHPYNQIAAAAAASIAIIAGGARVAAIRSQQMAVGGPIEGYSPHSKADNVPIMATAGEYMHPVRTVEYYGQGVMDALRKRTIPRELLIGYKSPVFPSPISRFAASGGTIASSSMPIATGQEDSGGVQIANLNISAVDAASFRDLGKRNPQVFVEVIEDALMNNSSLRKTMGSVLKGTI